MSCLKGVLIDFGNTIAHVNQEDDKKFNEEIASALADQGYERPVDEVTRVLNNAYRETTQGEVKDLEEFWRLFLRNLGIDGNLHLVNVLMELQNRHIPTIFRLYDGAFEVLSVLGKKYKLALVSNCAIGLSNVIEAMGLNEFFEAVVLSYEVGVRKPESRMYHEALKRLKLNPSECIFVSDEISDLEGARKIGLKTILVRQGERTIHGAKDPAFRAEFDCNHITEIVKYL